MKQNRPVFEPMNPNGWDKHFIVAIDFDGTLTSKRDGSIDNIAIQYVKNIRDMGCVIILWTSRYDNLLERAIQECLERGLQFDYINENPLRYSSDKISADVYIDDKSEFGEIPWIRWISYIQDRLNTKDYIKMERYRCHNQREQMNFKSISNQKRD